MAVKGRWVLMHPCVTVATSSLELWVNGIRSLSVSTLEANAAIEAYHIRLKSKISKEQRNNSSLRVDQLIHTLTTQFHASYWLDQYNLESGYFGNLRDKSFLSNAWNEALLIPDVDVMLNEPNLQLAKVVSQSKRNREYTIWNPGSEFSLCDCSWSRMGHLCKHVIKVSLLWKREQAGRPLLAAQVYSDSVLNLLHSPADNSNVFDQAILHSTCFQPEAKGLEDLSDGGLLQPIHPDINSQLKDDALFFHITNNFLVFKENCHIGFLI